MKRIVVFAALYIVNLSFIECLSQTRQLDITGNWCEFEAFLPYIQTNEPDVARDQVKTYRQNLVLSAGKYTLELIYDQLLDNVSGMAILGNYDDFKGLKVNNSHVRLKFISTLKETNKYSAFFDFELIGQTNNVDLELSLGATRPIQTFLTCNGKIPESKIFYGITPDAESKTTAIIHGIPFILKELRTEHIPANIYFILNPSPIREWKNGMRIECENVTANVVHFLGMVQQYDIANGSWYSPKGDHSYSHFVGDTAGMIKISFSDDKVLNVPMIYGFNFWYGRPWDILWFYKPYSLQGRGQNCDDQIFSGEEKYRTIIRNGVKLTDGYRFIGGQSNNARYIFSLSLGGKTIKMIEVTGNEKMKGLPLISAITVETDKSVNGMSPLPDLTQSKPCVNLLAEETITRGMFRPRVDSIMHTLYTFVDEHPKFKVPGIPANYFGPKYDFSGTQEAIYAATYLYKNGLESAAHIGDRGTGCSSSTARKATIHYTLGMGVWREVVPVFKSMDNFIKLYHERSPGELGGSNNAWSRGIGELLRETMALGYDKFIDTYVSWLDSCMFVDGNPPHWIRMVGTGQLGVKGNIKVGEIYEKGERENDGHGICMWGRYMVYHWMGRPTEWNAKRWKATEAAVDWIKWQLDTDTIRPGKRKDVLFTESECAFNSYDIYSSYNCLHGLKLSIRLAEQLGKKDKVIEWTALHNRMQKGILQHLVDSSEYGPIWHTERNCDWQDHAHKLVHLQLSTEGFTYTPLQDYATGNAFNKKYLDIDLNTYRYLMKDKNYNCLRMYGYGQGMMTQAALLLDQMEDATKFINMMVTYAYLPKFEGWSAPEGIIVHKSGKYYLPVNGYMGQDSHLADSQKALRLMLGIDDNNPGLLRIIPRFPREWTKMSIADYPVLTGTKRQKCQYSYTREQNQQNFRMEFKEPVSRYCIRLGPIPAGKLVKGITNGGKKIRFHSIKSGDSQWVWINDLSGKECDIKIILDYIKVDKMI